MLTRDQLVQELEQMRRRTAAAEAAQAACERTVQDLQKNAERLELALESSEAGTWRLDVPDGIYTWDDHCPPLFGLPAGSFRGGYQGWLDLVHPDDRERVDRECAECLEEITDCDTEYRVIWPDGSAHAIASKSRVYADQRGRAAQMTGVCWDITEQKQAEVALRESHALANAVVEGTIDAVFVKDSQGRYLMANAPAARAMRKPKEEVIGKDDTALFSAEVAGRLMATDREIMATGETITLEETTGTADATITWFTTKGPYRDDQGNILGIVGVSHNITERKRAEEELQEAHEKLERRVEQRTAEITASNLALRKEVADRKKVEETLQHHREMMMNMAEGVTLVRAADAVIVYANPQFARMFEYDPGELVGKQASILNASTETQAPEEVALEIMTSLREDGAWRGEVQNITKNGKPFWCHASVSTFESTEHGTVWVSVHEDITQSKKNRELLEASRDLAVALNSESNLQEAANKCLEAAIGFSGMGGAGLYVVDDKGGLNLIAHRGLSEEFVESVGRLDPESAAVQRVLVGDALYVQPEGLLAPVNEICKREGLRSVAILPIRHRGRVFACLNLASTSFDEVPMWARTALEETAAKIGGAIARIKSEETLASESQSLRRLLDLQERERKLVAHEIHDGFVQDVVGAKMVFEGVFHQLQSQSPSEAEQLRTAGNLLARAVAEGRRLIGALRPMIIDEEGVIAAIEYLIAEEYSGPSLRVELSSSWNCGRLDSMVEGAVFRIVQEALTNVKRHSQSDSASVELIHDDDRLRLEICDSGVGFDPEVVSSKQFGLRGIRERARLFGGHATIDSAPGDGTRITVELPIRQELFSPG